MRLSAATNHTAGKGGLADVNETKVVADWSMMSFDGLRECVSQETGISPTTNWTCFSQNRHELVRFVCLILHRCAAVTIIKT